MEIPYQGRTIVEDNFDHIKIIIPAKKQQFTIVFSCVWLCGWLFGEVSVLRELAGGGAQLFLLIWVIGWTFGGFMVFRTLAWQIAGKEIIEVGKGTLVITKKGDWFDKPKTYDLSGCKSFRVQDGSIFGNANRYANFRFFNKDQNIGTFVFDYGYKTIRFGEAVDEAEAKYLLEKLRSKRLLTEKNFD